MRVSPYQRIRRCSYSSKELMHWPTSSSLFFSFFLGDPVDMVTPRSIYNDVNSPKIGFQYLLGWYQSQKNSLHRCMTLYQSQLGKVSRKKSSCSFGFCPNYLNPPPPNLDNLYHFFERQCAKKFGQGSPLPPHTQIDPIYTVCEKWTKNFNTALPPPH